MGKIKANLDPSYEIEKDSRYIYHVAVERRTLPKGAMEFISTKWVVPYHTKMEFEQFKKYPRAAGINGAHSLIHDPVKQIADEKDEANKPKKVVEPDSLNEAAQIHAAILMDKKLTELRTIYPDIGATSVVAFIGKVMDLPIEEQKRDSC